MEKIGWMKRIAGVALAATLWATPRAAEAGGNIREIEIVVQNGYTPDEIVIREGERVRLRFLRKDRSGCTGEVVFASLGIREALPTGEPVVIEIIPLAAGEIEFRCGMNMVSGKLIVKPHH